VLLTLGNGEQQPVTCEFCAGFQEPKGVVYKYQSRSGVREHTITGVAQDYERWRYYAGTLSLNELDLTDDPLLAERMRVALHEQAEQQAQRNFESQFKTARKKTTWTAGYHRAQVADLERKLAWHRAKLGAKREVQ
jgi:hypothetical protein